MEGNYNNRDAVDKTFCIVAGVSGFGFELKKNKYCKNLIWTLQAGMYGQTLFT